ncbi:hypothetical protein HK100_002269 [Physocladia obscura]|uniref:Uncharacterized protein n=1 Tax=Physocladia obscura TaxID=109957 RepID=A0AAD5XFJ6_9FUNG|nr:hypothetical protein HK100_002269 [Physocladia obscura]
MCKGVLLLCIVCSLATFPYIETKVSLDSMYHCEVAFNSIAQSVYISADVFINIQLSVLFGIAISKHIAHTKEKAWDASAKLSYILHCDVRGAFLDTIAQLIKLALNISPSIPASQSLFGSHVCDFIKVVSAHWFVSDVANGTTAEPVPPRSQLKVQSTQQQASSAQLAATALRKGSFGTRTSQYFKEGSISGDQVLASADTLKFNTASVESLSTVRQNSSPRIGGGAARIAANRDLGEGSSAIRGRSIESLRVASPLGEGALRSVRSSSSINMTHRREMSLGRQEFEQKQLKKN